MSRVDVVIPTFNGQQSLERAIASAVAVPCIQRVIVIDDGSDPPAETALGRFARDDRIRVIAQANAGTARARNRGLDATSAELVVLLDTDDTFRPEIAIAIELARRTGAPLTIGGRVSRRPDGLHIERRPPADWLRGDGRDGSAPSDWGFVPEAGDVLRPRPILMFAGSGLIISRRALDADLRFDSAFKHTEDRDFCRRAADLGRIAVSSELLVDYYERDDGGNQSGYKHIHGITRDFLLMISRHYEPRFRHHWKDAAAHRARCFAKFGTDADLWRELLGQMRSRGLKVPLKARLRWVARRALRSARVSATR